MLDYDWHPVHDPDGLVFKICCATKTVGELCAEVFEGKHGEWLGVSPCES